MKISQYLGPLAFALLVMSILFAWRSNLAIEPETLAQQGAIACVTEVEVRAADDPGGGPRRVTLPHDWRRAGNTATQVNYAYHFSAQPAAEDTLGVLLPAVNLNVALTLNGQPIKAAGRLDEPIAHNNFTPLLFDLPRGALAAGENELLLRVVSFPPGHGFLGEFCVGPYGLLQQVHARQMLLGPELARIITVLSLVFTVVMGFVWTLRRGETMYGWMAATLLFWTLHSLKYHVSAVPISSLFWAWYLFSTSLSSGMSSFFLIRTFYEGAAPRLHRAGLYLWALMLGTITLLALAGSLVFYPAAELSSALTVLLVAASFLRSLPSIWRNSTFEAYCLLLSMGFVIAVVAYDNLLVFGFFARTSGQLAILCVPVLLGVFAYMVLRRFVAALDERENLVQELEERSRARALRIVDLEKASALAEQRETIMRDMHDGLGGYLVSLLALADRPTLDRPHLQAVVQQALTDMRLMLDSLDIDGEDLSLLMGALRDRMQPSLQAAGCSVNWQIEETPPLKSMSPHRALQVLRIVQESLNNALRHSGATGISVSLTYDKQAHVYTLDIADNGAGIDAGAPRGRGLDNMRYRAADIGATIEIGAASGGGTRVRLVLKGD